VPTVERLEVVGFFFSIATAGERPSIASTSGLRHPLEERLAYVDSDSMYRRCPRR